MNKISRLALILVVVSFVVQAQETPDSAVASIKIAKSPENRVAVLELYTSEGCSSCPPADRFLSNLKQAGISSQQIIPLAFHVTYWDYIGWRDRFAKKQYDQRQRDLAAKKKWSTVYTPQFVLSGDDYRLYSNFSRDVNKLIQQKSAVDLELSFEKIPESKNKVLLKLLSTAENKEADISLYFVVLENNLSSDVDDGENEGERLHHDYVVRELLGPYFQRKKQEKFETEREITVKPDWQENNLSIVAFAENTRTGEVLQAVRLNY